MKSLILFLFLSYIFMNQVQISRAQGWFGFGKTTSNDTKPITTESTETTQTNSHSSGLSLLTSTQSNFGQKVSKIPIKFEETTTTPLEETTGKSFTDDIGQNTIAKTYPTQPVVEDLDEKGCSVRNLIPELPVYFNNSQFSDFEISLGQYTIKVHQLVLGAKSSLFRETFQDTYSTSLEIKDEDIHSFTEFLRFFYTEKIIINKDTDFQYIKNVYLLAKKYGVNRLKTTIEEQLKNILTFENMDKVLDFARHLSMTKTVDDWQKYIRDHSNEIFQKQLYINNDSITMESILFSMQLNETQKIMAIKRIKGQNRSDVDLTRFRRFVNVHECNAQDLKELKDLQLLKNDEFWEQVIEKFGKLCKAETELKRLNLELDVSQHKVRDLSYRNQELIHSCEKQKHIVGPYYSYAVYPQTNVISENNKRRINYGLQ